MSANETLTSPELRAWLTTHRRTNIMLRTKNNIDSRAYWESAMAAGVVQLSDIWMAPSAYFEHAHRFVPLADFDIFSEKTLKALRKQFDKKTEVDLHNVWYNLADKKGWTVEELAKNISAWTDKYMSTIYAPKSEWFSIEANGWMDLLATLIQEVPSIELERAYLISQHYLAHSVGQGKQEATKYFELKDTDERIYYWWTQLPAQRREVLKQWCIESGVLPIPAIQREWLNENPDNEIILSGYLQTMDNWWAPTSSVDDLKAHSLRMTKVGQLLDALPLAPNVEVWKPYVFKWFTAKVCEALWSLTENDVSLNNANKVARFLDQYGLLFAENDRRVTIAKRLLEARARMKSKDRVQEDGQWVEGGANNKWAAILWPDLLVDDRSIGRRLPVLLEGVKHGLPMETSQKQELWVKAATNAKVGKHFYTMLRGYYGLPEDAPETIAVDAWLNDWFPGRGNLLTSAVGVGLNENRKELISYLNNMITTVAAKDTTLPTDFNVAFTL